MKKRLENKAVLIIIILLLFHAAINFYVLDKSTFLRKADDASKVSESLRFHQRLMSKEYKNLAEDFYILPLQAHPKFYPLTAGVIKTFLDKVGLKDINWMVLATNAFFLFILLISVFKTGALLYDEKIGLLAVILLSFSLAIFSHSRISMLDFPLTAMLSLCFLCLLKTRSLSSLSFSLFTGILFGLTQLTKETAVIFILPVFLYYFFHSLHSVKEERKEKIINFVIILLLFLIVAGIVYLNPSNREIFRTYWGKSFFINNNSSSYDMFYYAESLPLLSIGIIFSAVLFPLFLSYIYNIRKRNLFLTFWFFAPILFFSISSNKTSRFIMPVLPSLFLLLSSELFNPVFLKIRKIYGTILISSSFLQYAAFNFFPQLISCPSPSEARLLYDHDFQLGLLSVRHDEDFYLVGEMADLFKKQKTMQGEEGKVILATFTSGIFIPLEHEFTKTGMSFFVSCPQTRDVIDAPAPGTVDWERYLLTADYVIHKTGDMGKVGHLEDISGAFKKSLEENAQFFEEIARFKKSNGDLIFVYKNLKKIDDFVGI